ncbi:MAG TPA: protein-L-isoaspartate(D-aspartate) O-methyltransferase [Terriglobales bacterium]|nr:protein-L-isoaspartate(D-aspartate) O-methyltransferase [Terriglobales bacterium]
MPVTDQFELERRAMVARQLRARGIRDERVLAVMERVPRHEFVPPPLRASSYDDNPVPIGEGQTVSQPYIVAYMLEALEIQPSHHVLEIGTGTGYQAALLAELAREVVTVERVPALFIAALDLLAKLGYTNVEVVSGDGTRGVAAQAPFDRIIVAAAAPEVPRNLFDQLSEGGKMIIPVGSPEMQDLLLVRKVNGRPQVQQLEGCRFVPLIGEQGFTHRQ